MIKKVFSFLIAASILLSLVITTEVSAKSTTKETPFVSSLSGKLIFADGDGITKGVKLSKDSKKGIVPTYAALTAYRNNARYISRALSGSTMGCVTVNGVDYKGYASQKYKRYQKAPKGADYITLWFGWNDNKLGKIMYKEKWLKKKYKKDLYYPRTASKVGKKGYANKAQVKACNKASGYVNGVKYTGDKYFYMQYLGSIKSSNTETFLGAYNYVLNYFATNSKYAGTKISIVVPYGTTKAMRNGVRLIAKKYSVNCIDLYGSCVPLFYGKEKLGKSITKKTLTANRKKYLADGVHPNKAGHVRLSNIYEKQLKKKLIYTDGDSITKGTTLEINPETGVRPTYAALTAQRNNARFINKAIGGTTMGCVTVSGKEYKGFSSTVYNRYKKAPSGADYITLMFGWNDNRLGKIMYKEKWLKNKYGKTLYYPINQSQVGTKGYANKSQVEACNKASGYINGVKYTGDDYFNRQYIGNINSKNTDTFYGAYNFVLTYLTTSPKYKKTKIGIIVPYGTTVPMRNAVRQIAKKFKIPCLDLYDDDLPLFFGKEPSNKTVTEKMCAENQAKYLSDGVHPNEKGQKLLSTIYEPWLKNELYKKG